MVLFFTHIPFVVNHTINAISQERLQQDHPLQVDGNKFISTDFEIRPFNNLLH